METEQVTFNLGEYISDLGLTKVELLKTNGSTYSVKVYKKEKDDKDGFKLISSTLMNNQDILEILKDDPDDEIEVEDISRFNHLYEKLTEDDETELEVLYEPEENSDEKENDNEVSKISYEQHVLNRFNDLEFKIHSTDLILQNMHERLNEIKSLVLEMFQED